MKSSTILTRAAELVDSGEEPYFDLAIRRVTGMFHSPALYRFVLHMDWPTFKNKQHRVLALLLCAAIAESEGD